MEYLPWTRCCAGREECWPRQRRQILRNSNFGWNRIHTNSVTIPCMQWILWLRGFKRALGLSWCSRVRTLCLQCRGHRFNPWLGNKDPIYHMVRPKNKKCSGEMEEKRINYFLERSLQGLMREAKIWSFFVLNPGFCSVNQRLVRTLFGSDVLNPILRWNFMSGIAGDMLGLVWSFA